MITLSLVKLAELDHLPHTYSICSFSYFRFKFGNRIWFKLYKFLVTFYLFTFALCRNSFYQMVLNPIPPDLKVDIKPNCDTEAVVLTCSLTLWCDYSIVRRCCSEGGIWVLVAPVPVHCLLIAFTIPPLNLYRRCW